MGARATALAIVLAAALGGCGGGGDAERPQPLRVALDFQPNAAHAGVYMARRERPGRLRILVPSASTDSLKLLAARRSDLSIVDIHDLGLARQEGADVVGVGALVQRPLAAVIARRGIRRPRELEGQRVGVTGLPSDEAVLRAVVSRDGGDPRRLRRVTVGFSAVPSLTAGTVDAVVAFWNAEGEALKLNGVPTRQFRLADYGAPPYPELVLVARRETFVRRRRDVRAALAALRRGTEAALRDPAAARREIESASGADPRLVRRQLRAVAPVLRPPLRLDRRALEGWASFDVRFGILRRRPDISRAFELGLAR